jgi:hypothetical protein
MTDTLTAEVLRNALMVAAEEASIVVVRSAYSTFIVEGSDASAAILDSGGRLIAQSVATTLANSMSLSLAVPHIVDAYPLATMAPGDVFATNDAYQGGIHTNDIIVVRPVFVEGPVEFFTGTLIHVSDLGGMSAGGMAALATDIFLEGLQLPPVRIASKTGLDPAIERILRLNSRTPDKVIGDVRALIAGATTAARRIETLADELGPAALRQGVVDYLAYTEARMRRALAGLTPGVYRAEYAIDDDRRLPCLHRGADAPRAGRAYARRVPRRVRDRRRWHSPRSLAHRPRDGHDRRRSGRTGLRGDRSAGAGRGQLLGLPGAGWRRLRRPLLPRSDDPDERREPAASVRPATSRLPGQRPVAVPVRRALRRGVRRDGGGAAGDV